MGSCWTCGGFLVHAKRMLQDKIFYCVGSHPLFKNSRRSENLRTTMADLGALQLETEMEKTAASRPRHSQCWTQSAEENRRAGCQHGASQKEITERRSSRYVCFGEYKCMCEQQVSCRRLSAHRAPCQRPIPSHFFHTAAADKN